MTRIACGWCGHAAVAPRCAYCRRDPTRPYWQRGIEPEPLAESEGRPALDERDIRDRYDAAKRDLASRGKDPTVEALAEALDRSPRTVRQWKARFGL